MTTLPQPLFEYLSTPLIRIFDSSGQDILELQEMSAVSPEFLMSFDHTSLEGDVIVFTQRSALLGSQNPETIDWHWDPSMVLHVDGTHNICRSVEEASRFFGVKDSEIVDGYPNAWPEKVKRNLRESWITATDQNGKVLELDPEHTFMMGPLDIVYFFLEDYIPGPDAYTEAQVRVWSTTPEGQWVPCELFEWLPDENDEDAHSWVERREPTKKTSLS